MDPKSNTDTQQSAAAASETAGASESQANAGAGTGTGTATPPAPEATNAKKAAKEVEVRLLITSELGRCNDVVLLPSKLAALAVKEGKADDTAEAVAYAKSLAEGSEG